MCVLVLRRRLSVEFGVLACDWRFGCDEGCSSGFEVRGTAG